MNSTDQAGEQQGDAETLGQFPKEFQIFRGRK